MKAQNRYSRDKRRAKPAQGDGVPSRSSMGRRVTRKRSRNKLRPYLSTKTWNIPSLKLLVEAFSRIPPELILIPPPGPPACPFNTSAEDFQRLTAVIFSEPFMGYDQARGVLSRKPYTVWLWLACALQLHMDVFPMGLLYGACKHRRAQFRHSETGRMGYNAFEDATGIDRLTWKQLMVFIQPHRDPEESPANPQPNLEKPSKPTANVVLPYLIRFLEQARCARDGRVRRLRDAHLRRLDRKGNQSAVTRASKLGPAYRKHRMRVSGLATCHRHSDINKLLDECAADIEKARRDREPAKPLMSTNEL